MMKYSTYTWDLVQAHESASPTSCKTPANKFNSQQIVSYCLGLRTQNPGLREVDLEPSPKRGSDKIWNEAEKLQKKTSRIVQPGLKNAYQNIFSILLDLCHDSWENEVLFVKFGARVLDLWLDNSFSKGFGLRLP